MNDDSVLNPAAPSAAETKDSESGPKCVQNIFWREAQPDRHSLAQWVVSVGLGGAVILGLGGSYLNPAGTTIPVWLLLLLVFGVLCACVAGVSCANWSGKPRQDRQEPDSASAINKVRPALQAMVSMMALYAVLTISSADLGSVSVSVDVLFIFGALVALAFATSFVIGAYFFQAGTE